MTDIVERLKRGTEIKKIDAMGNYHTTFEATLMEHEAAAEIERLRADNARLRAALEAACNHVEWLLRYVPKTGSSDAAGAAVNARDFLEKSRSALEGKDG